MKKILLALLLVCGALGSVSTVSAARRHRRSRRHHRRGGFGGGFGGGYSYDRRGLGIALGGLSGVLATGAIARSEASHEEFRDSIIRALDKAAEDIDEAGKAIADLNARVKALEGK